ncbi:tRNA (adenosine(37)-N6)-dimethylallyltransferase MiaA [Flavobacterium sp. GT3R68]|uniref:tRNA (adenosine(37)-N6)-dimethylallyltransferase MiaA n=1 Tax=Flavobacterium sp. GT3R68 TaxID=2594437 RepID=UPI000F887AAD|nr:tRNA (adenosine(37)-N6)-dimethylallyltransferase MiaA [Flavobacterium sp. GT3R68]RTY95077.1 tRNA (adenosine(37)-N6)-dimethylallyltransferase MiaA [Flavobacterium sp. GSN2]TRW91883.1 tRNA (adenosine(37)-N6)-dimethylallyltransferase MiaA [Flavobacterium sp. GT3R68]
MKYLITIVGPTAIGKTSLSIALAQYFNCDIISCDSRQFFTEMSIGTAAPSKEELAAANHHFIHNKSIFENYTVGDFEKEAIVKLDELYRTNDYAILVGGSGLYVDAILKGFDDFPEIDSNVREDITANYEKFGIEYLQEELEKQDPVYFDTVAKENPQRLMRALEVCIGSGKPYSSFLHQVKNERNFIPIKIGLETDREIIYDRINRRVDIMMSEGLLEEAKNLYPQKELNALQTVGYRELFSYFDGEFTLEFAISEIKKNSRRFAKRQLTWFKKNEDTKWFDFTATKNEIIDYINCRNK